jgi:hypothetical protein
MSITTLRAVEDGLALIDTPAWRNLKTLGLELLKNGTQEMPDVPETGAEAMDLKADTVRIWYSGVMQEVCAFQASCPGSILLSGQP